MPPERKIFISYRRADNPLFADRIRDKFITIYGRDNVFMDIDSLPRGAKVIDRIRAAMEQSDAVIVVVGKEWVKLFKDKAAAYEDDFVKMELELALKLRKPITPICIDGADVPAKNDLPPKLRRLLDYNFAFLNRNNFHEEMDRIIADIEQTLIAAVLPQAQAYYESANNKLYTKDYDGAIADYTAAIQLNPNFAEAYKRRGAVRNAKGEADTSIADYSEAIRLKPQDAEAYYNRGLVRKLKVIFLVQLETSMKLFISIRRIATPTLAED